MPCMCGEVTCICFYDCFCRPASCLICQACMVLRDPRDPRRVTVIHSPRKQNHSPSKSRSRKKSAQRDPSNRLPYSLDNNSSPGPSQMNRSASAMKTPKPPSNNDPHATLKKQLSQPTPPLNYDPHPILRKQLSAPAPPSNNNQRATLRRQSSQPAPPSNDDQFPTLIRQLSEPCMVPISENLFSELPSSTLNKNPPRTRGSSLSSFSNNNSSLPSITGTGSFAAPSKSGFNQDFKSSDSTKSGSKKIPTTLSDSSSSCASIEYIKKASDKALPSFESFSSHFATPSNDNDNRNVGLNTSQNQDIRQTSTDLPSSNAEIHTPLYLETSGASSASSCNNPQSLHSSDRVPLQLSPQEHPLNLSLSAEDKHKISRSQSLELSSQSPSAVAAKQQRMDTMEFSDILTSECDNQRRASFSGGSSDTFSTTHVPLSSDSTYQGSYPTMRSESTASISGSLSYTSCTIQNPSQYTVNTGQYESPMETETSSKNLDQNMTSCPLSDPSTSSYFPPHFSQAEAPDIITYCNDLNDGRNFTLRMTSSNLHNLQEIQNSQSASAELNRFPETSENPYLEQEVFSPSDEQTSSTDRLSVIRYSSSLLSPQSTSVFSTHQATNPVNITYQSQSHQASSSPFPPSMNPSDVGFLASLTSNETQIDSFFQPTSSDVNLIPAFSISELTESIETYPRNREPLLHHPQSSTLQSASFGIPPAQRSTNYQDEDETDENKYSNRSKRKLS